MKRPLLVAVGGAALAVALAAAFGALPAALAALGRDSLVVGTGLLAVAVGAATLRTAGGAADDRLPVPSDGPPAESRRVGATIDYLVERPGLDGASLRRRVRRSLLARRRVRETAIDVLADRDDLSTEEAAASVRDGTWTDDPRAAACLAEDVEVPLRIRVEDWVHGARDRRQFEAAIAEIDALANDAEGGR
ncbi:DUF7269 family protein [Salinilacihabitans rarus]|uniref:DUF7269 family protein n=1 Tax=Salinilacihabitans rarus TaxID=2961596 RepID=UPI0020C9304B|nr:hypothetical protein [Salinilacihabitans rarus]